MTREKPTATSPTRRARRGRDPRTLWVGWLFAALWIAVAGVAVVAYLIEGVL